MSGPDNPSRDRSGTSERVERDEPEADNHTVSDTSSPSDANKRIEEGPVEPTTRSSGVEDASPSGMTVARRRLLRASAGVTGVTALAGCTGFLGGDESDAADDDADDSTAGDDEDESSTGDDADDRPVEQLSEHITQDTTLDGDVRYRVDAVIEIDATVTIEPGAILEFTEDSGLVVDGGAIVADATDDAEILLTGTSSERGWWRGIDVDSQDEANRLNHVVIEYAGRDREAAVRVGQRTPTSTGTLALSNSTIRESESFGLLVDAQSAVTDTTNNTYTDNAGPVMAAANVAAGLSDESSFTGNDQDRVYLRTDSLRARTVAADATWGNLDVPYVVESHDDEDEDDHRTIGVRIDEATLTVDPGTTLEFEDRGELVVASDARLLADASGGEEITFTGTTAERGWWGGIVVDPGDREIVSRLNHVVVEYAGYDRHAAVNVGERTPTSTGGLELTNSTIRSSQSFGLLVDAQSELADADDNTYTNNAGPVMTAARRAHGLATSSSFVDNETDEVFVRTDTLTARKIDEDATWGDLGVPYGVESNGDIAVDDSEFRVDPGVTIVFGEEIGLNVRGGARLVAEGTRAEPVTFTGQRQEQGGWKGIGLDSGVDVINRFDHAVVEYAGYDRHAAVGVGWYTPTSSAVASLTNTTIRESESYGLLVDTQSSVVDQSNNTYTENAAGAVILAAINVDDLDEGSSFGGNDTDEVYVLSDSVPARQLTGSHTWPDLGVPYRLQEGNTISIESESDVAGSLTVDPGVTMFVEADAGILVDEGSVLTMVGTEQDEIELRSPPGMTQGGGWHGITVHSSGFNNLEHVTIANGGLGQEAALEVGYGATNNGFVMMTHSTIRDSGSGGVWVEDRQSANDDICSINTYIDNGGPDCVVVE